MKFEIKRLSALFKHYHLPQSHFSKLQSPKESYSDIAIISFMLHLFLLGP